MSTGRNTDSIVKGNPGQTNRFAKNDHIQVALIGSGKMGQGDARAVTGIDGVQLVAACDLYDGRLTRLKELYGEDLRTTKDYREVLDDASIDVVIIATSDHWHSTITVDALNAGKAVYVEKPMVQLIHQGHSVIDAEKTNGRPLTVGAQGTSSASNEKARELLKQGAIGTLNYVEAFTDRFSYEGAWQYPIPPSASEKNVDWETYLKDHPKIPFDPKRFFWFRNYQDYGTGVAGDLFVHQLAGIHQITESVGPTSIMATGGIRLWEDGRDVCDIMLGLFDYPQTDKHPEFTLSLRVNFADGSGGGSGLRFIGSEGEMILRGRRIVIKKTKMADAPGARNFTEFGERIREELEEDYRKRYANVQPHSTEPEEQVIQVSQDYSAREAHFGHLFRAMRDGTPVFHDATFGFRSAAPALACNISSREKRVVGWDPVKMRLT